MQTSGAAAVSQQNEEAQKQVAIAQESLKALTSSLAESNAQNVSEPGLMDGSVISVKEEWSFVVGNLGEKQGVKIGMPMRVMRDDRKIATLRVVDVRQKICGAVVQEMDSKQEKIRVGDHLQVDAQGNVSLK